MAAHLDPPGNRDVFVVHNLHPPAYGPTQWDDAAAPSTTTQGVQAVLGQCVQFFSVQGWSVSTECGGEHFTSRAVGQPLAGWHWAHNRGHSAIRRSPGGQGRRGVISNQGSD